MSFLRIWLLPVVAAIFIAAVEGAEPASRPACPLEGVAGEAFFRDGLRRRGLTGLVDQYLSDWAPADEADVKLRRRESLLAEAASLESTAQQRREILEQARALLEEVLTADPLPPGRLALLLELARDDLERIDPASFDATLLFELPGRDRRRAATLAGRAAGTLASLQNQVAATWAALEELDEEGINRLNAGGMTVLLEAIQADAAHLQCWAGLFEVLEGDSPSEVVRPVLERLLEQTVPAMESPEPPPGQERRHCRQLLVGAVAARLLGRFEQADACARQVVAVAGRIRAPAGRQAVRTLVLTAVLEQLRAARDAGRFDQLRPAIEQVRAWLMKNRPDEAPAWLGLALIESSAAAAEAASATQSAPTEPSWNSLSFAARLDRAEALAPLEAFAARSPVWRDGLYAACAGAARLEPPGSLSGFGLQLVAGAMLVEAAEDRMAPPETLIEALTAAANPPAGGLLEGERLFLLARAHYLAGRRLEAVEALVRLLEDVPGHDRGPAAAQEAVVLAGEVLAHAGEAASPRVLQAFIRAVRGLRALRPEAPLPPGLQFRLAAAVERSGDAESAEKEYAAVGKEDPFALSAALGRLRCWMTLLQQVTAGGHGDSGATALATGAVQAGEEAGAVATAATPVDDPVSRCTAAQVTASWAAMLNHPLVSRAARALEVLDGFESRFAGCDEAFGWALRERVRALETLNRLPEARAVVEQCLQADPGAAGPVMARLLASMRREVRAALERDETVAAARLAGEAAVLARRLSDWADAHPEGMSAVERSTLLESRGWALRLAGRPAEALEAYDACRAALATMPAAEPAWLMVVQVGRAECLLDLDRPAEALPLFMEAWRRLPERADDWWRALTGSLAAHLVLGSDPAAIVQTVRQQRGLSPDLGGPYWKRRLEQIERQAGQGGPDRPATRPAGG